MTDQPDDMDTNRQERDNDGIYRDWVHDLPSLQEIGENILDEFESKEPHSPRDYPSETWLTDNGYAQLKWILRTKHDLGLLEFFVLLTSAESDGFEWDIDDVATIERATAWLDDQAECRDWNHTTKRTNRYRLNTMLTYFAEEYGEAALISIGNDPSQQADVYDAFKDVIKRVRREHGTSDSGYQYMRVMHRFTEWLTRSHRLKYDPMAEIEEEFTWELNPESEGLSDAEVRQLWDEAETLEEYVLIIGYCIWGLRTKELPSIHVDQFVFDSDDPRVEFETRGRKNGMGSVSLLLGLDIIAAYLDNLRADPEWNGYLFPSDEDGQIHRCAKTMRRRFKSLCDRADVSVQQDTPTPKAGRSWYYNILSKADTALHDAAAEYADEQGSKDPGSIVKYYLTEEQRRHFRRMYFRHYVRSVLGDASEAAVEELDSDADLEDFM